MKRILLSAAMLFMSAIPGTAKVCESLGNCYQTITEASASCTEQGCVTTQVPYGVGSASVSITSAYTGTLQFEQSSDNGTSWVGANGYPQPSGSAATSATSTGTWVFAVGSRTNFRVRCSAFTTGRPVVVISLSSADTTSGSILSINALSTADQLIAVGTSGTDVNVQSDTATHTLNVPDASAVNRGAVTTGTQSIAGAKTFTGAVTVNGTFTAANTAAYRTGRVTTGSINAVTYASVTLTWGTTFADTSYTPVCTVTEATATALTVRVHHIESFTASAIVVGVYNDAAGAKTGTLNCVAIHD